MSLCDHKWTYTGNISKKRKTNKTIWNMKCTTCKKSESELHETKCEHSWCYKGLFGKENWKKSCFKCGYKNIVPIESVFL